MPEAARRDEIGQERPAEAVPYRNEWQFRRLLEKLPAGAYTCDADGLITYFNQHAVQIWGREPKLNDPADRFCGSFKLFAADQSPIAHDRCWMALALSTGEEYNGLEIVIERPDGRRVTTLAHANPIRDESGRLLGAVNVLVDITDRKRAEDALREADRAQGRVPGHARPRAAQPARPDPQRACRSCELQGAQTPELRWARGRDRAAGGAAGPAGRRPARRLAASASGKIELRREPDRAGGGASRRAVETSRPLDRGRPATS